MEAIVEQELGRFVEAAREALGVDLVALVLFGSAAEDQLRLTSDVNLAVVARRFEVAALDALRPALAVAEAAIRLRPMFLVESEIADAAEAFAVKLDDIRRRHRVLHGSDPFASLAVPRAVALARVRQVLLNLAMRLRAQLASIGDREEQLALAVANAAGPLRACAAELLDLEGRPAASGRAALETLAGRPLDEISRARERGTLPAGVARRAIVDLIEICAGLRAHAARLLRGGAA